MSDDIALTIAFSFLAILFAGFVVGVKSSRTYAMMPLKAKIISVACIFFLISVVVSFVLYNRKSKVLVAKAKDVSGVEVALVQSHLEEIFYITFLAVKLPAERSRWNWYVVSSDDLRMRGAQISFVSNMVYVTHGMDQIATFNLTDEKITIPNTGITYDQSYFSTDDIKVE